MLHIVYDSSQLLQSYLTCSSTARPTTCLVITWLYRRFLRDPRYTLRLQQRLPSFLKSVASLPLSRNHHHVRTSMCMSIERLYYANASVSYRHLVCGKAKNVLCSIPR